jgi:hypothetical protein
MLPEIFLESTRGELTEAKRGASKVSLFLNQVPVCLCPHLDKKDRLCWGTAIPQPIHTGATPVNTHRNQPRDANTCNCSKQKKNSLDSNNSIKQHPE